MSELRVFCAGLPRTGTSTLTYALRRAGLAAAHGAVDVEGAPLGFLLHRAYVEGRDPMHYVPQGVEAVADPWVTRSKKWGGASAWPCAYAEFYTRLREHHPDAWIILTTRPVEEWISSVDRWKDLRGRITKADLPYLPPGWGSDDQDLADWFTAYHERVRQQMQGDERFFEVRVAGDHDAPRIIEERTGIQLPWWGVRNAGPKEEESE